MHHKRRRPKNRRAGCLMCKSYKVNGTAKIHQCKFSDEKKIRFAMQELKEIFKT